MSTKIISTGSYIPETLIHNQEFETIFDTSDSWIEDRTGIKSRHYEAISNVNMALNASLKALENLDIDSIDCIIVGTYTPDTLIPGVANTVRMGLGITRNIPAFDVNAACSGFMYALQIGHAYIQANLYKRVLVIGSDFNSRILNYTDRASAILFGDGAGAVVIEKSQTGILGIKIAGVNDVSESLLLNSNNDGQSPFLKRAYNSDAKFEMKGREVYKFAVNTMEKAVKEILEESGNTLDDVDYLIAHQANQRILDLATKNLGISEDKVLSNVRILGNTSSGSVPILLDQANRSGLLKEGMKIVLVAFGGGLTYGVSLLEW